MSAWGELETCCKDASIDPFTDRPEFLKESRFRRLPGRFGDLEFGVTILLALVEGVGEKAEAVCEGREYALGVWLSAFGEVGGEEGNAPGMELVVRSEEGRLGEISGADFLGVTGRTGCGGGGDGGGGGMDVPDVKDSERDDGRPGSWKEGGPRLSWVGAVGLWVGNVAPLIGDMAKQWWVSYGQRSRGSRGALAPGCCTEMAVMYQQYEYSTRKAMRSEFQSFS